MQKLYNKILNHIIMAHVDTLGAEYESLTCMQMMQSVGALAKDAHAAAHMQYPK